MRRFAGHAALAVAAFASLATSKPGWQLSASPPPTAIPDDRGTLAIVEASRRPEDVRCLGVPDYMPAAMRSESGTHYEFVCPPGTHISEVSIGGKGGNGCSKPEPPPGEFVRFVAVKPIEMWRAEARTTFPVVTQDLDRKSTYAPIVVEVGGAVISRLDASLGQADPAIRPPRVQAIAATRFDITIFANGTTARRAEIAVHATGWGICEQGCTPGTLTIGQGQ